MLQRGKEPEKETRRGEQTLMITTIPIPEVTRLRTSPEGATIQRVDAEPFESPVLADVEEEEVAEMWAADPGNQGS